jgi:enoyl-[acyl-carrier-protein] reductase (NADH)
LEKWQIAYDTQARAFFAGVPTAAKHMNHGGRTMARSYRPGGATGGWQPWTGMGSAKAALESMCRYLAVALAPRAITVNAIGPGPSDETTLIGQTPTEFRMLFVNGLLPDGLPCAVERHRRHCQGLCFVM